MRKDFNPHRIFSVNKHGRRFIALHTNMAAVTSCENVLYGITYAVLSKTSKPTCLPYKAFLDGEYTKAMVYR